MLCAAAAEASRQAVGEASRHRLQGARAERLSRRPKILIELRRGAIALTDTGRLRRMIDEAAEQG